MKYIRTKDGRIIKFDTSDAKEEIAGIKYDALGFRLLSTIYLYNLQKEDIIKVADTIEELFDEFVVKDNDCDLCYLLNDESKYAIQYHLKDQIDILVNDFKMQNDTCYGAIWTEWGLKYVAKMNDKGELELL